MSLDTGSGSSRISVKRNDRDQLTSNLKELEDEVQEAVRQRAFSRRGYERSLASDFPVGLFSRETRQPDEARDSFPSKYLQPSNVESRSQDRGRANAHVHFADEDELGARRERYVDELARIESVARKREAELREMDMLMSDHRHELDIVVYQLKEKEARLRRVTEEENIIKKRMEESSNELKMADKQLESLENKTKELLERRADIGKDRELKEREISEIQQLCEVSRGRLESLNQNVSSKSEALESKEKQLKDVESRLHLSLSLEQLKEAVETTEAEQKKKLAKCLNALKDGEVALDERAAQLARLKHEVQAQTVEYHEMSCKITKARAELRDLDTNLTKKKEELEIFTMEEERKRIYHQGIVEEANGKLGELNEMRNNTLATLKEEREELAGLSKNIMEHRKKLKSLDDSKKTTQTELQIITSNVEEAKTELDNLKEAIKNEEDRVKSLKSESEEESSILTNLLKEMQEAKEKHVESLRTKESLQKELNVLEAQVEELKRKRQLHDEAASEAFNEMQQQQKELLGVRQEMQQASAQREATLKEMENLEKKLEANSSDLCSLTSELDEVRRKREVCGKELADSRSLRDEIIEKIKLLNEELEKIRNEKISEEKAILEKRERLRDSTSAKEMHESEDREGLSVDHSQEVASTLREEKEQVEKTLKNATERIHELENQLTQEKENAQRILRQVTSKAKIHQEEVEQMKMERTQAVKENDVLYKQLEEYQMREKNLSQELSRQISANLQQKSQLENQAKNRAQEFENFKDQIQALTSSTKAEVARNLREVEVSRDQAVQELEQLQLKKNEMEMQLSSLQMSLSSVSKRSLRIEEHKAESLKHEKEEARRQIAKQELEKHQSYLKEQIREQMHKRAAVLDEEKRKAQTSLEGLSTKLTDLEQVISRKNSGMNEFQHELLKSRIEREKSLGAEKELQELKRRLQTMAEERRVILGQRNHLVMLNEERMMVTKETEKSRLALSSEQERSFAPLSRTQDPFKRSLDSLTRYWIAPESTQQALTEQYMPGKSIMSRELPGRGSQLGLSIINGSTAQAMNRRRLETDSVTHRLHHDFTTGNIATYDQIGHAIPIRDTDISFAEHSRHRTQSEPVNPDRKRGPQNVTKRLTTKRVNGSGNQAPSAKNKSVLAVSFDGSMEHETAAIKRPAKGMESSSRMSMAELDSKRNSGPDAQRRTKATIRHKDDQSSVSLSASTVVENKRIMFLASVDRLKNDKLKELEHGLQKIIEFDTKA